MADIRVSEEQVQGAVHKINVTITVAEDAITSLRSQIHAFLSPNGGLHLSQTSPVLQAAHETFHSQFNHMLHQLNNFSTQFQQITRALHQLDQDFASRIQNGTYR
jgi:hypothetical protein